MTKSYRNIVFFFSGTFFLWGCSKTADQGKENYVFYGHVTDCTTGRPLTGVTVIAEGYTNGYSGIYSSTTSARADVGSATTDRNGFFTITPKKQGGLSNYYTYLKDAMGEQAGSAGISHDSISRSRLSGYDMSFGVNSYGNLKITFTNSVSPNDTDQLVLVLSGTSGNCGSGYISEYFSAPLRQPTGVFTGKIQNGVLYAHVVGNSYTNISYAKNFPSVTDTFHHVAVLCGANDTTYYNINY